jgi:hypothetical protein
MLKYHSNVNLFNKRKGCYLTAEKTGTVSANRKSAGTWEVFTIEPVQSKENYVRYNDVVRLKSSHEKYLSAQHIGALLCNREEARGWEAFRILKKGSLKDKSIVEDGEELHLRSERHNRYICAEMLGFGSCNRKEARSRETFTITNAKEEEKSVIDSVKNIERRPSSPSEYESSSDEEILEIETPEEVIQILKQFQQGLSNLKSVKENRREQATDILKAKSNMLKKYFESHKAKNNQERKLKSQFDDLEKIFNHLLRPLKQSDSPTTSRFKPSSYRPAELSSDEDIDKDSEEEQPQLSQVHSEILVLPSGFIEVTDTEAMLAHETKEDLASIERDLDDLYEMMADMQNLTKTQGIIIDSAELNIVDTNVKLNTANHNVRQASDSTAHGVLRKIFKK